MSQEKLNNQSLRSKFEDLDSLPGEELQNKNAAWNTLHDRLRKKPQRIKPLWYWAAAVFIIACVLPFIITNKNPDRIAKDDAGKRIQPQQIKADTGRPVEMPIVISVPLATEEKKSIIVKANDRISFKDSGKNDKAVAVIIPEQTIPQQQETIQPFVVENPQQAIVAAPAKKKLRVVSINELDTPQQESATASSLPSAIATKKFYNISTTTPPAEEYAGVLKIKISLKH
jgi:hypothetical protein